MREDILRRLTRWPIPIMPMRLATSQYSGEWESPYKGKGLEFRSHRPYQLGDDFRTIHMATSVRTGRKMVVERVVRRDINMLVVLDCTPSMGMRHKADVLLTVALMLVYSGISLEMRTGAALAVNGNYYRLGTGMGHRHGLRLFNRIETACRQLREGSPLSLEFPRVEDHKLMPVGGILLYLSDFLDERGYSRDVSTFAIESHRYDFVPVVIQDGFEYSFPDIEDDTLLELNNPETGHTDPVWMGRTEKKLIRSLHEKRFAGLQENFSSRGIPFVHVQDPALDEVHRTLNRFFVLR